MATMLGVKQQVWQHPPNAWSKKLNIMWLKILWHKKWKGLIWYKFNETHRNIIDNLAYSWPTDLYALHLEKLDCPTSIEPFSFAEVITDLRWCQVMCKKFDSIYLD
jgi:hypothetical protein